MTTGRMSPGLFLGGGVEFLAEGHDVDALLAERGADGRRRVRLPGGNLQFDVPVISFAIGSVKLLVES